VCPSACSTISASAAERRAVGGLWGILPAIINITPYATPNALAAYLLVRLKNLAVGAATFYWQLQLVVLRWSVCPGHKRDRVPETCTWLAVGRCESL
jgi:hypothetical protein